MLATSGIKSVQRYVKNIDYDKSFGIENITVEHRSNNPKRDFLFVNKKQCKHIPCSASEMVNMCEQLTSKVHDRLVNKLDTKSDNILVIAFAETATAIGNVVSEKLIFNNIVLQTTREEVEQSKELISFEEEHSHATTQKLLVHKDVDVDEFLNNFSYILFVEDEISTGNTILNFIHEFEKLKKGMKYGVASICNWQSGENKKKFAEKGIDTFALITGTLKDANQKMAKDNEAEKVFNSYYHNYVRCNDSITLAYKVTKKVLGDNLFRDERLGHPQRKTDDFSDLFFIVNHVLSRIGDVQSVRVVGTEEFMYVPIKVAEHLEKEHGFDVICHSTTRSPIDRINSTAYGWADSITCKSKVPSPYDSTRDTYLYNTDDYIDVVLLITDGKLTDEDLTSYYELFKNRTKNLVAFTL